MKVMLLENGLWGSDGPKAGDEGEAFYFTAKNTEVIFFVKFPGYREYHACRASAITALITEVMN